MNFREALDTAKLVIMTGEVPLLIGGSGIGKTSLVMEIAKELDYEIVTIDANLLKEGEIGGLPIVSDIEVKNGNSINKKKVTTYAIHNKLVEVDLAINENKNVLLFVDELNRCDHTVQQELMNLVLNREINGYKLSDKVYIIAAMNPSNRYEGYEESNYQVVDMDPAQENRFVWIKMESDLKQWLNWAMGNGNIHSSVIEFLSAFPEYLNVTEGEDSVRATPRSWERVSKAYKVYEKSKVFNSDILCNVVKGNVGISITQDFMSYIKNMNSPLINFKDILEDGILTFDKKEIIRSENHSRLYILAKNALRILDNDSSKKAIDLFSDILDLYPKDLRLGIMREIKSDVNKELYNRILDNDKFINAFFNIYS